MTTFALAYLLNALWQVPLVYLAALLLAHLARRAAPVLRHRLWVGALALQIVLPSLSFAAILETPLRLLSRALLHRSPPGHPHITVTSGVGYVHGTLGLPRPVLLAFAAAYLLVTLFFLTRLLWSLAQTHRLRRRAHPVRWTAESTARWQRYKKIFNVPDAELAISPDVRSPVTLGIRHRLLLLPPHFETAIPDEDLHTVLAHEFAHMARHDFARNLAYHFLSLPLAFHPLLRFTFARIAETREIVCDARAAAVLAGPQRYVRSLLRLASSLLAEKPSSTLHAIGIFDAYTPNTLEKRIMSLTAKPTKPRLATYAVLGIASAAIVLGTCASALALRVQVAAPGQQDASRSQEKAVRISGGVMATSALTKVPPVYPQEARDAKVTGAVVLAARIGKDGTVQQLTVVSGPEMLRSSALEAVHQWTYRPYFLNGNPREVDTTITVTYSLDN